MVRLFATDLDGTFLEAPLSVHPDNVAAVRAAAERGVPTIMCTGRPYRWLGFLREVGTHGHAIVSNGAAIVELDSGAVEQSWPMDPDTLRACVEEIRAAFPEAYFSLEWGDQLGTEQAPEGSLWTEFELAPIEELIEHSQDPVKLLVRHPDLPSDVLAPQVGALVGDRLSCTYSWVSPHGQGLAELAAPGVCKARALEAWTKRHGYEAADVAAFGDMPNDLAMLRWAGRGFVMPTGHESMRNGEFEVVDGPQPTAVGRTMMRLLNEG